MLRRRILRMLLACAVALGAAGAATTTMVPSAVAATPTIAEFSGPGHQYHVWYLGGTEVGAVDVYVDGADYSTNPPKWAYQIHVTDTRRDNIGISARVDPGNGVVVAYNSTGCGTTATYLLPGWNSIRKWRSAWGGFATGWQLPPTGIMP